MKLYFETFVWNVRYTNFLYSSKVINVNETAYIIQHYSISALYFALNHWLTLSIVLVDQHKLPGIESLININFCFYRIFFDLNSFPHFDNSTCCLATVNYLVLYHCNVLMIDNLVLHFNNNVCPAIVNCCRWTIVLLFHCYKLSDRRSFLGTELLLFIDNRNNFLTTVNYLTLNHCLLFLKN